MQAPKISELPLHVPAGSPAPPPSLGERIGRAAGRLIAPLAGAAARMRRGRALHLSGTVCVAEVVATADDPHLVPLARSLAGAAIVRLSGALWRRPGPPELLGCAVRFRGERPLSALVAPEDQDLLFVSVPSLWLMLPGVLRTRAGDYLHNAYYTASPLELPGLGPAELRLVPAPAAVQPGDDRDERLDAAMQHGVARLRLEVKRSRRSWQPLCDLRLRGRLGLADDELAYSPFHHGAGLHPRGFINAMRAAVYVASQRGRAAG